MKKITWLGNSHETVKSYSNIVKQEIGYNLDVAKFTESIYVLHAFVKKTQQPLKRDIDLAKKRYTEMREMRRINQ